MPEMRCAKMFLIESNLQNSLSFCKRARRSLIAVFGKAAQNASLVVLKVIFFGCSTWTNPSGRMALPTKYRQKPKLSKTDRPFVKNVYRHRSILYECSSSEFHSRQSSVALANRDLNSSLASQHAR